MVIGEPVEGRRELLTTVVAADVLDHRVGVDEIVPAAQQRYGWFTIIADYDLHISALVKGIEEREGSRLHRG